MIYLITGLLVMILAVQVIAAVAVVGVLRWVKAVVLPWLVTIEALLRNKPIPAPQPETRKAHIHFLPGGKNE